MTKIRFQTVWKWNEKSCPSQRTVRIYIQKKCIQLVLEFIFRLFGNRLERLVHNNGKSVLDSKWKRSKIAPELIFKMFAQIDEVSVTINKKVLESY